MDLYFYGGRSNRTKICTIPGILQASITEWGDSGQLNKIRKRLYIMIDLRTNYLVTVK